MNRLIRRKEVEKMTGLVKSSIYLKIKEGVKESKPPFMEIDILHT